MIETMTDRNTKYRAAQAGAKAAVMLAALFCTVAMTLAQTGSSTVIAEYRNRQEQARGMTVQLLTDLIDSHLQKIRDNNLTDVPLYEDLTAMRERIAEIALRYMPEVQQILSQASTSQGEERTVHIRKAQQLMHAILKRLIAERELVRARRQQAELIERVA